MPPNSSPSGATMTSKSMTPASRTTSLLSPQSPKSSSLTPLADIKPKSSERLLPLSSKDSLDHSNSTAETPVRKSRPSESSDTPLKSSISWLEETHLKSLSRPSNSLDQEKTQPRLVLEVLPESKPLTSHQWEELTWPFTCWLMEPESTQWETTRLLLSVWLMRSSTLRRGTNNHHTPSRRRKKLRRLPRVTDDLYLHSYMIRLIIESSTFDINLDLVE